jgi:hypothetical protein
LAAEAVDETARNSGAKRDIAFENRTNKPFSKILRASPALQPIDNS